MKKLKLLYNPFEKYSEKELLVSGATLFIIGSLLAYFFNGRFDSFLHLAAVQSVFIQQPFVDNLIIFICLFLFLFLLGKYLNPKTRAADILTTVLVGNAPFYLSTLTNINNNGLKAEKDIMALVANPEQSIPIDSVIYLIVSSIVGIVVLVWCIALFYNGFKTATNAKSTKAVALFIVALIAATVLTNIIPHF